MSSSCGEGVRMTIEYMSASTPFPAAVPEWGRPPVIGAIGASSTSGVLVKNVVKLPVLGPGQERRDLSLRVDEGGAVGEPGVAERDLAVREQCDLYACPVRVAVRALAPGDAGELGRRHPVVDMSHGFL